MADPYFERTVVLLFLTDDGGAMGVVINREGPVTIEEVTTQVQVGQPVHGEELTWWGGPVGEGACFVLWRGESEEGWTLSDRVAVSPSVARLEQLVREQTRFWVAVGYAGWGPGQLEQEIRRGSWLYADLSAPLVFETPLAERYDAALGLLGLTAHTVWMTPIDE